MSPKKSRQAVKANKSHHHGVKGKSNSNKQERKPPRNFNNRPKRAQVNEDGVTVFEVGGNFIKLREELINATRNKEIGTKLHTIFRPTAAGAYNYYDHDDDMPPDLDPNPSEEDKIQYKEEASAVIREKQADKRARGTLATLLIKSLSTAALQACKSDATWETHEADDDPLEMWRIMVAELATGGAVNKAHQQKEARDRYFRIRQVDGMVISELLQEFTDVLSLMKSVSTAQPSGPQQAQDFYAALNSNYGDFIQEETNLVNKGVLQPPATLAIAYQRASQHRVRAPTRGGASQMAPASLVHVDNMINFTNNSSDNDTSSKRAAKLAKQKKAEKQKAEAAKKAQAEKGRGNGERFGRVGKTGAMEVECNTCGEIGHYAKDCPQAKAFQEFLQSRKDAGDDDDRQMNLTRMENTSAQDYFDPKEIEYYEDDGSPAALMMMEDFPDEINANIREEIILKMSSLNAFDVVCDNGANICLFHNADLLDDIVDIKKPVTISGVGGKIVVTQVGTLPGFGTVFYSPDAPANVLSFSELWKRGHRTSIQEDGDGKAVFVTISKMRDITLNFPEQKGLYICDMSPDEAYVNLVQTLDEIRSRYTIRQLKEADAAQELKRRLGSISSVNLRTMTRLGMIKNCDVTASDVWRNDQITKADVASLKGKTKWQKPRIIKPVYVPLPTQREVDLHIDLGFSEGEAFVVSATTPLKYIQAVHLSGNKRDVATVRPAVMRMINAYKSRGYEVKNVLTDGEGAIAALTPELNAMGINVNPTGAGQHVPIIENVLRQIKERMRCVYHTLPYALPVSEFKYLFYYCVKCLNMQPSGTSFDLTPPFEKMHGRKIDAKIDLRAAFGDYAQIHAPEMDNSVTKSRTDPAIALYPTGSLGGTWKWLNLRTGGIVSRDQWDALPLPPTVQDLMNARAKAQKKQTSRDPIFSRGKPSAEPIVVEVPAAEPSDARQMEAEQPNMRPVPAVPFEEDIGDPAAEKSEPENTLVSADKAAENHRGGSTPPPDEVSPPSVANAPPPLPLTATPADVTAAAAAGLRDISLPPEWAKRLRGNRKYGSRDGRYNLTYKDPKAISECVAMIMAAKKGVKKSGNIKVQDALLRLGSVAKESIMAELEQLHNKGTWKPVHKKSLSGKQLRKVIRSSMFLKEKFLSTGEFEKLKARLVAGGHMQDRSIYADREISSPTVNTSSVFMVAAIAAKEQRYVVSLDVVGAYLNAMLKNKTLFMKLHPQLVKLLMEKFPKEYAEYVDTDGSVIVQLLRALYGCVESAKLWYELLAEVLIAMGFKVNRKDPCVFNRGSGEDQVTICFHVDDLLITSKSKDFVEEVVKKLIEKFKTCKVHRGAVHPYLGMTFDFSSLGKAKVTMEGYINDMLREYEVTGGAKTPATTKLHDIDESSEKLSKEDADKFHSRAAKLLYPAKRVRPDLLCAVNFLCTRVQCSTAEDWRKLQRVLKYVNSTKELGIVLEADTMLKVWVYIDAAYGIHPDGKSHSGLYVSIGRGPIVTKSSKQKLVTKSSTEAELVGASDEISLGLYARDFLIEQGYEMGPATLYQDNKSTMQLIEKGRSTSDRTRHINVRYFFLKDRADANEIQVEHLSTEKMVADILTKPLQGELFRKLRAELLNWK